MKPDFVVIDNQYVISELEKILKNDISTVTKNKYQILAVNLVRINITTLYKVFDLFSKLKDAQLFKNFFKSAIKETNSNHNGKEKSFPYLHVYGSHGLVAEYNFLIFLLLNFYLNKENFEKIYKIKLSRNDFNKIDYQKWDNIFVSFYEDYIVELNDRGYDEKLKKEFKLFLKHRKKFDNEYYILPYSLDNQMDSEWYNLKVQYDDICKLFFDLTKTYINSSPSKSTFSSTKEKGTSFEEECKNILIEKGWKVDTTPSSNDQGADLIATRGLLKLIAQCKNYDGTVGNDAVQQVISAKAFYKGTVAVVVSNSDYTNSAKQLAEKTEVLLLKKEDLRDI